MNNKRRQYGVSSQEKTPKTEKRTFKKDDANKTKNDKSQPVFGQKQSFGINLMPVANDQQVETTSNRSRESKEKNVTSPQSRVANIYANRQANNSFKAKEKEIKNRFSTSFTRFFASSKKNNDTNNTVMETSSPALQNIGRNTEKVQTTLSNKSGSVQEKSQAFSRKKSSEISSTQLKVSRPGGVTSEISINNIESKNFSQALDSFEQERKVMKKKQSVSGTAATDILQKQSQSPKNIFLEQFINQVEEEKKLEQQNASAQPKRGTRKKKKFSESEQEDNIITNTQDLFVKYEQSIKEMNKSTEENQRKSQEEKSKSRSPKSGDNFKQGVGAAKGEFGVQFGVADSLNSRSELNFMNSEISGNVGIGAQIGFGQSAESDQKKQKSGKVGKKKTSRDQFGAKKVSTSGSESNSKTRVQLGLKSNSKAQQISGKNVSQDGFKINSNLINRKTVVQQKATDITNKQFQVGPSTAPRMSVASVFVMPSGTPVKPDDGPPPPEVKDGDVEFIRYIVKKYGQSDYQPNKMFWMSETILRFAASEVIMKSTKMDPQYLQDYLKSKWADAWEKVGAKKTGKIEATFIPQFMRYLTFQGLSFKDFAQSGLPEEPPAPPPPPPKPATPRRLGPTIKEVVPIQVQDHKAVFEETQGNFSDSEEGEEQEQQLPPKNKGDLLLKSRKGESLFKLPGDIDGHPFEIRDLEDCTVYLMDHTRKISISNCKGTKFLMGPVKKEFNAENCENCEFTVIANSLCLKDIKDSTLFIYTTSMPIIDNCQGLTFAPFNFKYPYLKSHCKRARVSLKSKNNKWHKIQKFTQRASEEENMKMQSNVMFQAIGTKTVGITRSKHSGEYRYKVDDEFKIEIPKEFETNQIINTEYMITVDSDGQSEFQSVRAISRIGKEDDIIEDLSIPQPSRVAYSQSYSMEQKRDASSNRIVMSYQDYKNGLQVKPEQVVLNAPKIVNFSKLQNFQNANDITLATQENQEDSDSESASMQFQDLPIRSSVPAMNVSKETKQGNIDFNMNANSLNIGFGQNIDSSMNVSSMMETSGIGFDYKAEIPSMNVGSKVQVSSMGFGQKAEIPSMNVGSNIEASGIGYRAEIPSMNIGSNIEAQGMGFGYQVEISSMNVGQNIEGSGMGLGYQAEIQSMNVGQNIEVSGMGVENQFEIQNMNLGSKVEASGMGFGYEVEIQNMNVGSNIEVSGMGLEFQAETEKMNLGSKVEASEMGLGYQAEIQNMNLGSKVEASGMGIGYEVEIQNMNVGSNIEVSGMGLEYQAEIQNMNVGSNIEVSGMGLEYQAEIQNMNVGSKVEASGMGIGYEFEIQNMNVGSNIEVSGMGVENQFEIQSMNLGSKVEASGMGFGYEVEIQNMNVGSKVEASGMGFGYEVEIQNMNVGSNIEASGMELGYQAEIPSINVGSNVEASGMEFGYNAEIPSMNVGLNIEGSQSLDLGLKAEMPNMDIGLKEFQAEIIQIEAVQYQNLEFDLCVTQLKEYEYRLSEEQRYEIYGLYMQVTEGNNNSSRPIEGAEAQAEWDAWKSRMGMSRDQASAEYIIIIKRYIEQFIASNDRSNEIGYDYKANFEFEQYASQIKEYELRLLESQRYELYGLYMQVTQGNNTTIKPENGAEAIAQWEAWESRKSMSRDEASAQYIIIIKRYISEFLAENQTSVQFSAEVNIENQYEIEKQITLDIIDKGSQSEGEEEEAYMVEFQSYYLKYQQKESLISEDYKTQLYGLYMQVTEGNNETKMPGILTGFLQRRNWKAWEARKGMKREEAVSEYIILMNKILSEFEQEQQDMSAKQFNLGIVAGFEGPDIDSIPKVTSQSNGLIMNSPIKTTLASQQLQGKVQDDSDPDDEDSFDDNDLDGFKIDFKVNSQSPEEQKGNALDALMQKIDNKVEEVKKEVDKQSMDSMDDFDVDENEGKEEKVKKETQSTKSKAKLPNAYQRLFSQAINKQINDKQGIFSGLKANINTRKTEGISQQKNLFGKANLNLSPQDGRKSLQDSKLKGLSPQKVSSGSFQNSQKSQMSAPKTVGKSQNKGTKANNQVKKNISNTFEVADAIEVSGTVGVDIAFNGSFDSQDMPPKSTSSKNTQGSKAKVAANKKSSSKNDSGSIKFQYGSGTIKLQQNQRK